MSPTQPGRSLPTDYPGLEMNGELVIWQAGWFDFAALQDRLRSGPAGPATLPSSSPRRSWCSTCPPTTAPTYGNSPTSTAGTCSRSCWAAGCRRAWCSPRPAPTLPSPAPGSGARHLRDRGRGRQAHRSALAAGVRGWQKLPTRLTAEAVVAGVIGPPHAPTCCCWASRIAVGDPMEDPSRRRTGRR